MKKELNYAQLVFLSHNKKTASLSSYFSCDELIDAFFGHLNAHFASSLISTALTEPFLSCEFQEPVQSSTLVLDDMPLGEFFLYHHSAPDFCSLVYVSSAPHSETALLNRQRAENFSVSEYLAFIEHFASCVLNEKKTHKSAGKH